MRERDAELRGSTRELLRRFLWIFLPLFVLSGGLVTALYGTHRRAEQKLLDAKQRNHVELQGGMIVSDFQSVVSDLMILAEGRALQAFLDEGSAAARQALADECRLLAREKRLYDQVRYLDKQGMEVVRVNLHGGEPLVVAADHLQPKGDRYYFTDTLRLPRGGVFVSRFDLNVEEGEIERPLKPTIRFGTPVFDHRERKRGIVVLNYLGAYLLEKLDRASAGTVGQTALLNPEGYWLKGPTPEQEWGFMYAERRARTFEAEYPEAWRQIRSSAQGQFHGPRGMFTFETVYPVAELRRPRGAMPTEHGLPMQREAHPYFWKIVSHVRPEVLAAQTGPLAKGLLALYGALALLLATVSWFLAWAGVRHRRAREQLLQSERLAAIGEAMTGLAHESRNALQRSQAGLEMMEKRLRNDPEMLDLLGEVRGAQYYLYELYEEVRGYAAPLHLRRRKVDLGELLRKTWSDLVGPRDGRGARLVEESDGLDLRCSVDPRSIEQVWRNILENALSAGARQPCVRAQWTLEQYEGQPAVCLTLRDNGLGLIPEAERRIFEPFYTTKARGTGLGMAIAQRLVEAHGGQIRVESRVGEGTEVRVVLPRSDP